MRHLPPAEWRGIPRAYPALSGDAFLLGAEDDDVIKLIFKGRDGMPAWATFLKDEEIAKILTYARDSWGNAAPAINKDQVAAFAQDRAGCFAGAGGELKEGLTTEDTEGTEKEEESFSPPLWRRFNRANHLTYQVS